MLRRYSLLGLMLGTLFLVLSLTPSLLPRSYALQGLISGISCLDPIDHKLYKFGKLYRARQVLRSLMTDRNTIDEHS